MKKRIFLASLLFSFAIEIAILLFFIVQNTEEAQDTVLVNEAVQTVQNDWHTIKNHKNKTSLDYVVIDTNERVLFRTKAGLSENINKAIRHRDTILDIEADGLVAGKIIVANDRMQSFERQKKTMVLFLSAVILIQCIFCVGYF